MSLLYKCERCGAIMDREEKAAAHRRWDKTDYEVACFGIHKYRRGFDFGETDICDACYQAFDIFMQSGKDTSESTYVNEVMASLSDLTLAQSREAIKVLRKQIKYRRRSDFV